MSGLIDATTGLRFGTGLQFQTQIGRAGLTITSAAAASAVIFDAIGSAVTRYFSDGIGGPPPYDYTHMTVGSGSNRALIAVIVLGYNGSGARPTSISCTWDQGGSNQAMTLIGTINASNNFATAQLYGLIAPTSGNKTLRLNYSNSTLNNNEAWIDAIAFTGVSQTGGATSFPGFTSADTGTTVAVTSATGDFVVASWSPSGAPTPTGTTIFNDHTSGSFINAAANYDAGAATVNIGMSSGNMHPIAACSVKAA